MKIGMLFSGNDGIAPFEAGDVVTRATEQVCRMVASGCAVPLDKDAEDMMARPDFMGRYLNPSLASLASSLTTEAREALIAKMTKE